MYDDDDDDDSLSLPSKVGSPPALPARKPKGALPRPGQEAKAWSRKFTDDPRWEKMIWFWIENPEMMPPGVFNTLMFYRFGKPPQTLKVKGEIMARPYLGDTPDALALRAAQLAKRLRTLSRETQGLLEESRDHSDIVDAEVMAAKPVAGK
jgi:hypothetical protein